MWNIEKISYKHANDNNKDENKHIYIANIQALVPPRHVSDAVDDLVLF